MPIPRPSFDFGTVPRDGITARALRRLRARLEQEFVGIWDYIFSSATPIGTVLMANLSAADITAYFTSGLGKSGGRWENWAICDGANGTPNLNGKFPLATTGAAGGTGGSDTISAHTHGVTSESAHTHSISSQANHTHTVSTQAAHSHSISSQADHTHSTPNHYHEMPIGFSGGTMYLYRDGSNHPGYGSDVPSVSQYSGAHGLSATSGLARLARTNNTGSGTTGSGGSHDHGGSTGTGGSHDHGGATGSGGSHDHTGATGSGGSHDHGGATGSGGGHDNRPAYHQLTFVMKVS